MDWLNTFQPHEMILLVLGTILFIILLIKLIKEKDISKNVIILMVLAVAMIGFSAVSKLSFQGFVMELNHRAKAVTQNPTKENIARFNESYEKLKTKKETLIKPDQLVSIASALEKTGKHNEAYRTINKAIQKQPESTKARTLQTTIERSLTIRQPGFTPVRPMRTPQPRPTPQ